MYFPYIVDLTNDIQQAKEFQKSLTVNEYYYVIEAGHANMNCHLKMLDACYAAKKVSDFSVCDLILLGKNRNQLMPPHFGIKCSAGKARIIEFISFLFDNASMQNDIIMLIHYLQHKHYDLEQLIIPSSINFDSNLCNISNINGNSVIHLK